MNLVILSQYQIQIGKRIKYALTHYFDYSPSQGSRGGKRKHDFFDEKKVVSLVRSPREIGDNNRQEELDGHQLNDPDDTEDNEDFADISKRSLRSGELKLQYLVLPEAYNKYKIPWRACKRPEISHYLLCD